MSLPEVKHLVREVLPPSKYREVRDRALGLITEYKKNRYVDVGRVTVLFEDAATVWLQIEETLFLEEELGEELLKEAVATYLPIVPRRGEISLTVMVNLFNEEELRTVLPRFNGIQDSVYIRTAAGEVKAEPIFPEDYGPGALPRSIHYLKARVEPTGGASLVFRHREINAEVPIPETVLEAIRNSVVAEEVNWAGLL